MRIKWIDQYKGFLGVLVVIGHTIAWSGVSNNIQLFDLLYFIVYTFHMPAFFVLSGLVEKARFNNVSRQLAVYVLRRFFNLLIPTIVFTLFYALSLMLFASFPLIDAIIQTFDNYWFMYVMIFSSVTYPILKTIIKNDWLIVAAVLLFSMFFGYYNNTFAKLFAYLLSYAVGSVLGRGIFTEQRLKKITQIKGANMYLTLSILILLLIMLFMYETYGGDLLINVYYKNLFGMVVSIILIPVFYKLRTIDFLLNTGRYTLQMYLIAYPVFAWISYVFLDLSLCMSVTLFLLLTAADIVVPVLFCKKYERTKLYNIIFKPYQYVEKYLPSMRIKA